MFTPEEYSLTVNEVHSLFFLRDGRLHWKPESEIPPDLRQGVRNRGGKQVDVATFMFRGRRSITKYLAWAVQWGRYPVFPLHQKAELSKEPHAVLKDLEAALGNPTRFFEAVPPGYTRPLTPAEWKAGAILQNQGRGGGVERYLHPLVGEGRRIIYRVVPPICYNLPLAQRRVYQMAVKDDQEGASWARARYEQCQQEFERRNSPGGVFYTKNLGRENTPIPRATKRLLSQALDTLLPKAPPPPLALPDDGYDPPGIWHRVGAPTALTPAPMGDSSLPGLPQPQPQPPAQAWENLPAPPETPVGRLDMMSFKAITRFCRVALALQDAYKGSVKGRPGVTLTITLGPLDGAWRAVSTTMQTTQSPEPGIGTTRKDIRESQSAALDGSGWSISHTVTLGRTLYTHPKTLRKALIAAWKANPPSEAARKAARSLWTASPVPTLGQDMRNAAQPVQAVLPALPGIEQETNIPLLLEQMLTGMAFAKEHTTERYAIHKVSFSLKRTTYGFTLLLKGATTPEGPRTTLSKRSIISKVSTTTLRQYGQDALIRTQMNSRTKLLNLAPLIVSKIRERLTAERQSNPQE